MPSDPDLPPSTEEEIIPERFLDVPASKIQYEIRDFVSAELDTARDLPAPYWPVYVLEAGELPPGGPGINFRYRYEWPDSSIGAWSGERAWGRPAWPWPDGPPFGE